MKDQGLEPLCGGGAFVKVGKSKARFDTYGYVDIVGLEADADAHVGEKVILRGTLFNLESGVGASYLEVDIPLDGFDPSRTEMVWVLYKGEVGGLKKGSELRIWGTCAGTCTRTSAYHCGVLTFPLVKADILQW